MKLSWLDWSLISTLFLGVWGLIGYGIWLNMMVRQRRRPNDRARNLLLQHLNAAQREQYAHYGHFYVAGQRTKRRYIVFPPHTMVTCLDNHIRYCIYARDVPSEDYMLAVKLLLEADEAAFLQIAIPHR